MKKVLLFCAALVAFSASAGTYSITTNAGQDAKLDKARLRANAQTCVYFNLPKTCTQTQAREEFCRRANLTGANCDGATQVDVYSNVQKFLDGEIVRLVRDEYGPKNDTDDKAAARAAWPTLTQAQRDAVCTSLGLAAQCDPW